MDFTGKVALITGASSGIGEETAVYFTRLGATVSLTGRNEDNLKKTVNLCRVVNKNFEPFFVTGDISKEEDVKRILNKTIEKFGRLDILINNAGFANIGVLESTTLENYDAVFNTNVRGVLLLTQLAMPHLIDSKGSVVNVSSVLSIKPKLGMLSYSMSKAALDQFTKCVALEVAPNGVRVNSVNPAGVKTNFAVAAGLSPKDDPHSVYTNASKYPTGRYSTTEEIAKAIAFLASDLASNIVGSIIVVDGGSSLT